MNDNPTIEEDPGSLPPKPPGDGNASDASVTSDDVAGSGGQSEAYDAIGGGSRDAAPFVSGSMTRDENEGLGLQEGEAPNFQTGVSTTETVTVGETITYETTTGDVTGETVMIAGSIDTSTTVTIDSVTGETVEVAQTINKTQINNYAAPPDKAEEKFKLWPITSGLEKIASVFVYPPKARERIKRLSTEKRVLIVEGARRTGRFAFALRLGLDLTGDRSAQFYEYKRLPQDPHSLLDFVNDLLKKRRNVEQDAEKNGKPAPPLIPTIYIIDDALNDTLLRDELPRLDERIERELHRLEALLILTVETGPEEQRGWVFETFTTNLTKENLQEVFSLHVERYNQKESVRLSDELRSLIVTDSLRHQLLESLTQAPMIDKFIKELAEQDMRGEEEERESILKIAKDISRLGRESPTPWFRRLRPNQRLFALLASLYGGLDVMTLGQFYTDIVKFLRAEGIGNLRDAREFGIHDMLTAIHASRDATNTINFDHDSFPQEIERQIGNYYHLLWMIIPTLIKIVSKDQAMMKPQFWSERAVMAGALARVGLSNLDSLELELYELAEHQHGSIVSMAGSALKELCTIGERENRPDYYHFVVTLLENWAKSGKTDLMWAVGASIWRIYETLVLITRAHQSNPAHPSHDILQRVDGVMTTLVQRHNQFHPKLTEAWTKQVAEQFPPKESETSKMWENRLLAPYLELVNQNIVEVYKSIVFAMRQMFSVHPQRTVDLVCSWMNQTPFTTPANSGQTQRVGSDNTRNVGFFVAQVLFQEYGQEELLTFEKHAPLLQLIKPTLKYARTVTNDYNQSLEYVRVMLRTLLNWLKRETAEKADSAAQDASAKAADKAWTTLIHEELLRVTNRASRQEHQLLRSTLSDVWLQSELPITFRIGHALIARSLVMDGEPLALPKQRAGLIVFDLGAAGRRDVAAVQATRRLFELLDPRVDIKAGVLGLQQMFADSVDRMGDYKSQLWKYTHPLPRLLMPLLHEQRPEDYFFVLAMTWDRIHDLDEVAGTDWKDRLIVIRTTTIPLEFRFGSNTDGEISLILRSDWVSDLSRIQLVTELIGVRLARSLANVKSVEWWAALREYIEQYWPQDSQTEGEPTLQAVSDVLDQLIGRMDNVEDARHPRDVTRTIAGALLWMTQRQLSEGEAGQDVSFVVDLLIRWMQNKDSDLYRLMGSAGAQLLYNLYAYARPVPRLAQFEPLLRLIVPLTQRLVDKEDTGDGVMAVLGAVRRWAHEDEWYKRLTSGPSRPFTLVAAAAPNEEQPVLDDDTPPAQDNQAFAESELFQMMSIAADYEEGLSQKLQELKRPLQSEGETVTPPNIERLVEQLLVRVALGSYSRLPALMEDQAYGLILVDAGIVQPKERQHLAAASRLLFEAVQQEAQRNPQFRIHPLLYRLGRTVPLATGLEIKLTDEQILSPQLYPRVRLAAPLLEQAHVDQVAFVVILTANTVVDAEDWCDVWRHKTVIYASRDYKQAWLNRFTIEVPKTSADIAARSLFEKIKPLVAQSMAFVSAASVKDVSHG